MKTYWCYNILPYIVSAKNGCIIQLPKERRNEDCPVILLTEKISGFFGNSEVHPVLGRTMTRQFCCIYVLP